MFTPTVLISPTSIRGYNTVVSSMMRTRVRFSQGCLHVRAVHLCCSWSVTSIRCCSCVLQVAPHHRRLVHPLMWCVEIHCRAVLLRVQSLVRRCQDKFMAGQAISTVTKRKNLFNSIPVRAFNSFRFRFNWINKLKHFACLQRLGGSILCVLASINVLCTAILP